MAKKLLEKEEVPGRTINRIVENFSGQLAIHFTDDTVLVLAAKVYDSDSEINIATKLDRWEANALEILTPEENTAAEEAERVASRQAQLERDRRDYEILKARLGVTQ